jgi:hypothetical protein
MPVAGCWSENHISKFMFQAASEVVTMLKPSILTLAVVTAAT